MKLENLKKLTKRGKKRVGRGIGSGRGGHTSGRGAKGQKARGKIPARLEGGRVPLTKRLPFRRGVHGPKAGQKALVLNLKQLNIMPDKSVIDLEALIHHKLVKKDDALRFGVKILGDGELKTALTVKLPTSGGARKKIEKAGGSVTSEKNEEKK